MRQQVYIIKQESFFFSVPISFSVRPEHNSSLFCAPIIHLQFYYRKILYCSDVHACLSPLGYWELSWGQQFILLISSCQHLTPCLIPGEYSVVHLYKWMMSDLWYFEHLKIFKSSAHQYHACNSVFAARWSITISNSSQSPKQRWILVQPYTKFCVLQCARKHRTARMHPNPYLFPLMTHIKE